MLKETTMFSVGTNIMLTFSSEFPNLFSTLVIKFHQFKLKTE